MIRLLIKILPNALLAFGLIFVLVGTTTQFDKVPTEPSPQVIGQLLETPPESFPEWTRVDDGILFWLESIEVYQKRRSENMKEVKHVFVPLVDPALAEAWLQRSIRDRSPRPTCVLVRFDRAMLREEFPDYFDHPEQLGQQLETYDLSFTRRSNPIELGMTGRVLEQFQDVGFEDFVIAIPGSEPLSKDDALNMAGTGIVVSLLSAVWIFRRRRKKASGLRLDVQQKAMAS